MDSFTSFVTRNGKELMLCRLCASKEHSVNIFSAVGGHCCRLINQSVVHCLARKLINCELSAYQDMLLPVSF